MKTVLLDTNCLIDLAEDRKPQADDLRQVVAGFRNGSYELVGAAITASENPRADASPKTWEEFVDLLHRAELSGIRVLSPMGYWDVTFWDRALWVDEEMEELERKVHQILAPNFGMNDKTDEWRWRNTKCDVQVVWSALWHKADLLVTSDKGILSKAEALAGLGATVISPASFATTISTEQAEKDAP